MWNMGGPSIQTLGVALVKQLREGLGASVPIVLSEGLPFGRAWAVPAQAAQQAEDNGYLAAAFAQLKEGGDANLHYVNTSMLFGPEAARDSGTAAGLHATDAGMHDRAAAWVRVLRGLGL